MKLTEQLDNIDPSAKDALFRRIMYDENLGYLRDGDKITGFELDLENSHLLSGYGVIAIQKHTILAYRSDLHEEKRLVLFPEMSKLEDPEFDLLELTVQRKVFHDDTFKGKLVSKGLFKDVAKDLIPPYKQVEVSDEMAASMNKAMMETTYGIKDGKVSDAHMSKPSMDASVDEPPMDAPFDKPPMDAPFDEPPMDAPFDEPPMDAPFEEPEYNNDKIVPKSPKAEELNRQVFTQLSQVSDYVVLNFGVQPDFASNVVAAALQSTKDSQTQIDVAVLLFVKLFNDGKL